MSEIENVREKVVEHLKGLDADARNRIADAIGMSPSTIRKWCAGSYNPSLEAIEKLVATLLEGPTRDSLLACEGNEHDLSYDEEEEANKHPPGFTPGIRWKGKEGEVCARVEPGQDPKWDDLLKEYGFGDVIEMLEVSEVRAWQMFSKRAHTTNCPGIGCESYHLGKKVITTLNPEGDDKKLNDMGAVKRIHTISDYCPGTMVNHYVKAKVVRRRSKEESLDLEELNELITNWRNPGKLVLPRRDDITLAISLSDWQAGKKDGAGLQGLIETVKAKVAAVKVYVMQLRAMGMNVSSLLIMGLGDLQEQCFSGDTEVITRTGIKTIKELADVGEATLKTTYGKWVTAPVKSFGTQRIVKLSLSRGQAKKEVYTTWGHRWFRLQNPSCNSPKEEVVTSGLREGDMLASCFGKHPKSISPIGVAAGYVFGDGNKQDENDPQRGCSVHVHRRDWPLLDYFKGHPISSVKNKILGEKGLIKQESVTEDSDNVKVTGLPFFFKDAPSLDESLPFLYGWAAGYFAADGCVSKGVAKISSSKREHLEIFAAVCSRVGIGTNPITSQVRKGCEKEPTHLFHMSLVRSTIPENFMVHPDKKKKFLEGASKRPGEYVFQRNKGRCWRVESVEETDREEEVYCAQVPEEGSFVLANDILTGNCFGHYPMQTHRTELDNRQQRKVVRRLATFTLLQLAPMFERVHFGAVGGNHGETRVDGKLVTSFGDNGDIEALEPIAEAAAFNPHLQHVTFQFPDQDLSMTMNIEGVSVGLSHGHQAGKGGPKRVKEWWDKCASQVRSHPIGAVQIMNTAHYHHLIVEDRGSGRTWIQHPALDDRSVWWEMAGGEAAIKGLLAYLIMPGHNRGWDWMRVV